MFIGDFHIHSHFSLATSKQLTPEYLDYWAKIKGIKVVGTGDFTHPGWLKELKEKLEPAEQGLYKLKKEYVKPIDVPDLKPADPDVRFILTAEISNIYKKNDKVRKVHNVIYAPGFETAEKIQRKLSGMNFNITSDGRPILGMDSRDLLELSLNEDENIFFVPAHIWTPWFSAMGSKSGFDSIDECYSDLAGHIHAVETGLSSDPPMNWACSSLDKYTLTANSDAHSPEKLGRNANLFNTAIAYDAIIDAMKTGDPKKFLGTIDFFPQEGKYHYDGHRKCNVCWNPLETLEHKGVCPVCQNIVTVGVMSRVAQLADREDVKKRKNRHPFYSLIPLKEILSEITGYSKTSNKINKLYFSLLKKAGSEFNLLLHRSEKEISKIGNEVLTEAIKRMRNREVIVHHGYDGQYGDIRLFKKDETFNTSNNNGLFEEPEALYKHGIHKLPLMSFGLKAYRQLYEENIRNGQPNIISKPAARTKELNDEQTKAAEHFSGPALVIAGPGTGKTRVLTHRIAKLIEQKNVPPEHILALTFTNKAAGEIRDRLKKMVHKQGMEKLMASTFHALGLYILTNHLDVLNRDKNIVIIDEDDKYRILKEALGAEKQQIKNILSAITAIKQQLKSSADIDNEMKAVFSGYQDILTRENMLDLDDLIYQTVMLFKNYPDILERYRQQFLFIMVDEYQDVNFGQYELLKMLMPWHDANLCVIGDPNQAIYGFRGSDIQYIQNFLNDYPSAKKYQLKKSYRCTDRILMASGGMLSPCAQEINMLEGIQKGVKINIVQNQSDKSEAEFIARKVEDMIGGVRFYSIDSNVAKGNENAAIQSLSDFVVLCRTRQQFKAIEKAFNDHSIAYQVVGNTPFFKQYPAKTVIDFFQLHHTPDNKYLRNKLLQQKKISLKEISQLEKYNGKLPVKDGLEKIIQKWFKNDIENNSMSFQKLLDIATHYGNDHAGFLNYTNLGIGTDAYNHQTEQVTIMSLHAAKGLEFKCVFITGCEDGLLPYSLFKEHESVLDEERRLMYVGMTRAKKYLFLTHASRRLLNGREYRLEKSPFLDNIEKELVKQSKSGKKKEKDDATQLNLFGN